MNDLSTTGNDRIRAGGNMSDFDRIALRIEDLYLEAANWADGQPVESQEQCDALDVLDKALLAAEKEREALRKEEVKPFDEGKAEVQARHNPIKEKVARARDALNKPRAAWKAKVEAEKAAAALKARLEAEEEARKAQEAMQASAGDLEARERAEEQLSLAKEAERYANKLEKRADTGNGLRTVWVPELTDLNAAIKHYWAAKRDRFEALVTELAAEDVRAGKRMIPGFQIHETKKAI